MSDLNASFGASDLAGSAEIALADERPFLTATLTSKNLDLRPLSSNGTGANGAAKAPAKPKGKKGRVFPDQPLPLDALRKLDARATLNVNRMLLPQAALNDLTAAVTLKDGILTAKPVTATIGGGSFDGVVDLRAGGDVADLDLRLDVAHLDLARMLKELNAKEIMQGSLNANINVSGRGQSVAALMGSLDGKAIVQIGDGRINNEYIDLLGADVGAGVLRLINPFAQKASHTDLDCFISRFDINDGIAESTVLVLNTSKMSVIGAGRVNLKTEGLDLSLKPSPKQGSATSVGGVSLNLGELVKPFKLSGTLANPKLAIDPTQTAVTIGKAAGGMALLGPIGAGAAMAGSGEGVSCAAAADAAKTGVKVKPASESSKVGKTAEDVANGAGEAVKGAGRKLRELFGR
ncbi:MAG: AsmA-like C-terminal region-containing protein [Candidatus Lindowbacteria bacterium]|nr:AsmA-like C-terminal region-containing protein [Candidatus Lindowbacteria bacterium]